jgi:hypothetical protein
LTAPGIVLGAVFFLGSRVEHSAIVDTRNNDQDEAHMRDTGIDKDKLTSELAAQARHGRTDKGEIDWGRAEQRWKALNNPVTILVLLGNITVWYLVVTARGQADTDLGWWGFTLLGLSLASVALPVIRFRRSHRRTFVAMQVSRGLSKADAEVLYRKTFPGD